MNIITPSTYMKSNTQSVSLLETECLYGEKVEILDKYQEWVYCKLNTDNYCGWIQKNSLGQLKKITHRVINKSSFIYRETNPKSEILLRIPMGARLAVENIKSNWAQTFLIINNKMQVGYVPSGHIVDNDNKVNDWVKIAQTLEGTPYRWGGRDTLGIDCSALLQLSYQTYGQNIPRNTSEQVNLKKNTLTNLNNLKRGCVVFWPGHVGIMIDKVNCIHANSFHMKTVTEPLFDIINRMDKDHLIAKMMDFN